MVYQPVHVKFNNSQNPDSDFDFIDLNYVLNNQPLDHSPFQLHLVDFYMIIMIKEGSGYHTIDFTKYPYKKTSIITVRKDQVHKFHPSKNCLGSILLFTDEFMVRYLEELEAIKALNLFNELLGEPLINLSTKEHQEIWQLVSRINQEYFKNIDQYSMGIIRSELHILISKLYRIKSKNNQIVHTRKYLNEFIQLQKLVESKVVNHKKVADYAKMMGVSTKTLNTVVRSIVNKSAKEFIDEIATKQIKRLLINTELTIKEIAYASGFDETTNFYKYFKRLTTQTPEVFRLENR